MQTRRKFLQTSGILAVGSFTLSSFEIMGKKIKNPGIQLYTFQKEMLADAMGTLEKLTSLGIKQIESAVSDKGFYYGLTGKEMKQACNSLGMQLRSGHVRLDDKWNEAINEAAIAEQEYLICASLPTREPTVENYKNIAAAFNKAGRQCKDRGIKFGYHNHNFEFKQENGKVLYDVLLEETDPSLVCLELDLGWVIASGKDPIDYFFRYPGRFPLWHLKDMDITKQISTEFGKGGLDIQKMFDHSKQSGLTNFFIEQEDFTGTPLESMQENMAYLKKIKG